MNPIAAATLSLLLTGFAHADSSTAVPDELRSPAAGALPAWVSADRAMDAHGNVLAKVGEHAVVTLRQRQERRGGIDASRAGECAGFATLPTPEHYRRNGTLRELTSEATDIVVGRVVARREGFFRGSPASLVRVTVTESLRASDELRGLAGDVYLVYPYATLRIGGSLHCTRVPGLGYEPAAGDRVVIFKYLPSASGDAVLIEANACREVIFEHGGQLIVPPLLASDPSLRPAPTFDALVHTLR